MKHSRTKCPVNFYEGAIDVEDFAMVIVLPVVLHTNLRIETWIAEVATFERGDGDFESKINCTIHWVLPEIAMP